MHIYFVWSLRVNHDRAEIGISCTLIRKKKKFSDEGYAAAEEARRGDPKRIRFRFSRTAAATALEMHLILSLCVCFYSKP